MMTSQPTATVAVFFTKGLICPRVLQEENFRRKTTFFLENSASRDHAPTSNLHREHDERQDDDKLLKTPVREVSVAPESFLSPKTTDSERQFTRLMDMEPVERPIFGSLADYWGSPRSSPGMDKAFRIRLTSIGR